MSEYDCGEGVRGSGSEDILQSIAKKFHLQRYGKDLIIAAHDKQFLLDCINADLNEMKIFLVNHLLVWEFDDDEIFVDFCRNCLTSESSFDLKLAAIMYLTQIFYVRYDYELLLFLRGVLSDMLGNAKTLTPPMREEAHKLSVFVYATILLCLDRDSELSNVLSPDLVLDAHVLDDLDRALLSKRPGGQEGGKRGT